METWGGGGRLYKLKFVTALLKPSKKNKNGAPFLLSEKLIFS
jgi:hypothetical protein